VREGCCRCKAWDTAVRQRALDLDGTTDAFAMFERKNGICIDMATRRIDQPSSITEQLRWLEQVGFQAVDVYWMQAGHVIFGAKKRRQQAETNWLTANTCLSRMADSTVAYARRRYLSPVIFTLALSVDMGLKQPGPLSL